MTASHYQFEFIRDDELDQLPEPEWLVDNIIPFGGFVQLYGAHEAGKTFLALDLSFHIATGLSWPDGQEIQQGAVVYVSGEGIGGLKQRELAIKHNLSIPAYEVAGSGVYVLPRAIQLLNEQEIEAFVLAILEKVEDPALIVIDTLARCTAGGDENSAQDMGIVIQAADTLRKETGATVLTIHHAGYEAKRGRGSSAMPGALDTILHLERNDRKLLLKCDKQKDADHFNDQHFEMVPTLDSMTIKWISSPTPSLKASADKQLKALYRVTRRRQVKHTDWMDATACSSSTFNRNLKLLRDRKQYVELIGDFYRLTNEGLSYLKVSGES